MYVDGNKDDRKTRRLTEQMVGKTNINKYIITMHIVSPQILHISIPNLLKIHDTLYFYI